MQDTPDIAICCLLYFYRKIAICDCAKSMLPRWKVNQADSS